MLSISSLSSVSTLGTSTKVSLVSDGVLGGLGVSGAGANTGIGAIGLVRFRYSDRSVGRSSLRAIPPRLKGYSGRLSFVLKEMRRPLT